MRRALRIVGLVLANGVLVLALLMFLNLWSACQYDKDRLRWGEGPDGRSESPVYDDPALARSVWEEMYEMRAAYRPYVGWSRLPMQGDYITVDADGDRVHPPQHVSETGEIHVFGGSTVWGSGVEDAGTLPAALERRTPGYRVYNHGESGFVTRQGIARLVEVLRHGARPDLVIFYDGVNDIDQHCSPDRTWDDEGRVHQIRWRVETYRILYALMGSLLEKHQGVQWRLLPPAFMGTLPAPRCHEDPERAARVVDTMLWNWNFARQVSEAHGADFVAVLQPVSYTGHLPIDYLELDLEKPRPLDFAVVVPLLQERIAARRAAGDTWLHDMTNALDGDDPVYIDFCHVSRAGNERLADDLASRLPPKYH